MCTLSGVPINLLDKMCVFFKLCFLLFLTMSTHVAHNGQRALSK